MPKLIDPKVKKAIEQAYMQGTSIADLAIEFNVTKRSIQMWAKAENWEGKRSEQKTANVIDFIQKAREPRSRNAEGEVMPPIEAAKDAIISLLTETAPGINRGRDLAAVSRELREWIKYKVELEKPKTEVELAEQFVRSGFSIKRFVQALKELQSESA